MVSEMQQRVRAAKPETAWGISPSGIWRNKGTDPLGSDTNGGQSYDNLHADTRGWVRKGWLDYIAPQLYWYIGQPPADYAKLVPWWSGVADGTGTLLWIGQAAYKAGEPAQAPEWQDPAELSDHLTLNRDHPQIGGDIWYNANDLRADRIGSISTAVDDHYTRPALAPVLPRLAKGGRRTGRCWPTRSGGTAGWRCARWPPGGTSRSSSPSSASRAGRRRRASVTPATWSPSSRATGR